MLPTNFSASLIEGNKGQCKSASLRRPSCTKFPFTIQNRIYANEIGIKRNVKQGKRTDCGGGYRGQMVVFILSREISTIADGDKADKADSLGYIYKCRREDVVVVVRGRGRPVNTCFPNKYSAFQMSGSCASFGYTRFQESGVVFSSANIVTLSVQAIDFR